MELKNITIEVSTMNVHRFKCFHRPDLEKGNWHYYEDEFGDIRHFRKEHMVMVYEEAATYGK